MKIPKQICTSLLIILLFTCLNLFSLPTKHYLKFNSQKELKTYIRTTVTKGNFISAHRGAPQNRYPENSLISFEHCLNYPNVMIECDISHTKDNQLILMHDDLLDRTTNGSGKVAQHNYSDIRKLKLKDINGKVTKYRVPLLSEVFLWAKNRAILQLDVKSGVKKKLVIDLIEKYQVQGHVILICYSQKDIEEYVSLSDKLMLSVTIRNNEDLNKLLRYKTDYTNFIAFGGGFLPDDKVLKFLDKLKLPLVFAAMTKTDFLAEKNGTSVYKKLYKQGADIICTDRIDLLSKAIVSE